MKNSYRNLISCLLILSVCYYLFHLFFFTILGILGIVGVDALIGIFTICLFYFIFGSLKHIFYNYFWSLTKNIWLQFVNLLFLVTSLKNLVLDLNVAYIKFLRVKVIALNLSYKDISNVFTVLRYKFFVLLLTNNFLSYLNLKLSLLNLNINSLKLKEDYNLIFFNNNSEVFLFYVYNDLIFLKNG